MSYGAAANDERILTYAPPSKHSSSNTQSTALPTLTITTTTPSSSSSLTTHTTPMPSSTTEPPSQFHPSPPPTSDSQQQSPDDNQQQDTTTVNPFLSAMPFAMKDRMRSYAVSTWADCRPWAEFYSTAAISVPSFAHLSDRVSTNLNLYKSNYQVIAVCWLALLFLFSIPNFLLAILLLVLLDRWTARAATKNGGKLAHKDMVIIGFAFLIIIWVTGIARNVLTSLGLSFLSIIGHASLHEPVVIETEIANV